MTTTVIDPVGNRTTFVYNVRNEVVEEIDPLSHSATFAYDAAGRMTSTTDRNGRRRDLAYDDANRQTGETWVENGQTVDTRSFAFDANGNLLTAGNGNGIYTFTYDALDRPSTVVNPFGLTLTLTFDPVGNRTLVEDSLGGITTSTYDAGNHLTRREFGGQGQTPLRIDVTWTARDQLAGLTRYADLAGTQLVGTSAYTWDDAGQLSKLLHQDSKSAAIASYVYTYDQGHRVTSETLNGTTTSYVYDDTNQLTKDAQATYTYDANGNRTMTGYQTGTGNQLLSDGTWTYAYDNEGNTSKKSKGANAETWTYFYDHANHLVRAEQRATDGGTLIQRVEYQYDALGNRIEQSIYTEATQQTAVERYALDGWKVQLDTGGVARSHIGNENFDVWADLTAQNALTMRRQYLDSIDSVFARIAANGDAAWYLPDRLGSIRDIVDATGSVTNHIDYTGFGVTANETNPSAGDRWKYAGREWDEEVGLYSNRDRQTDPRTGRFTQQDREGLIPDVNPYRFVRNSPTNRKDPSGLWEVPATWEAIERQDPLVVAWLKERRAVYHEISPWPWEWRHYGKWIVDAEHGRKPGIYVDKAYDDEQAAASIIDLVSRGVFSHVFAEYKADVTFLEMARAGQHRPFPGGSISYLPVRLYSYEELRRLGVAEGYGWWGVVKGGITWLRDANSGYGRTPQQIIRMAGVGGPVDNYELVFTTYVDCNDDPVRAFSGLPLDVVLIRNKNTGRIERAGMIASQHQSDGRLVPFAYEFYASEESMFRAYNLTLELASTVPAMVGGLTAGTISRVGGVGSTGGSGRRLVRRRIQETIPAAGNGAPVRVVPTRGMGGRVLSQAEQAEFNAFGQRTMDLGWIENPNRTGSWGRIRNGRFEELGRIDVGEAGMPGWRGRTHIHITGEQGHLPLNTPLPGEPGW